MSRHSQLWAISFGDLLTLLIFFFVAGFTLNNASEGHELTENTLEIEIEGEDRTPGSSVGGSGTLLAPDLLMETVDIPVRGQPFSEEELKGFLQFATAPLISSQEYRIKRASVTSCVGSIEGGFEQSMLQAFELRSQLLDVLEIELAVELIFDGSWCRGRDKKMRTGQIAFFLEQVNDG